MWVFRLVDFTGTNLPCERAYFIHEERVIYEKYAFSAAQSSVWRMNFELSNARNFKTEAKKMVKMESTKVEKLIFTDKSFSLFIWVNVTTQVSMVSTRSPSEHSLNTNAE
jgi:hypothetical protein